LRRRRFLVHGIQRKYIFLSLVPLIISSFLIIVFLFVPLDVLLYSSASPAAREAIVQDLRALGFRIWPAIFVAMLVSTFLSVFVTHRFAGPLYRFHQVVEQIAAGDLSTGFKLRKGDDLVELETALNRAIESLAATMQEAYRPLNDLTVRLETLAKEGRGGPLEQDLAVLLERAQEIHKALGRLKIA
jgi:methyl-accepting chemotaxis protein